MFGVHRFPQDLLATGLLIAGLSIPASAAPPRITDPSTPADLVVAQGGSGSIRVLAAANPSQEIRWFKDGQPIPPGTVASTLTFTNATPDIAGAYRAVLSNAEGSITSRVARVVVVPALDIRRKGNLTTTGSALALAVSEGRLFVGVGDGASPVAGLEIYDITTPATPTRLGGWRLPRTTGSLRVTAVAVEGTRAYLAANSQGIRVLDISNPAEPVEIGSFAGSPLCTDLRMSRGILHAATGRGLQLLDVTNPGAIRLIGESRGTAASGIAVGDGFSFLATGGAGVEVHDTRVPEAPVRLSTLTTGDPVLSVRLRGRHLFLSGGIPPQVYDVSQPARPFKRGGVISPVDSRGVTLLDSIVLDGGVPATGQPQHLSAFDVSTLPHVVPIGRIAVGGAVEDIAVHDNLVFAAVSRAGVDLFELEPQGPPIVVHPLAPVRAPAGSNIELEARISGGPLAFQWFRNSEALPGETNRVLRLRNLSGTHVGAYSVTAISSRGSATSGPADFQLTEDLRLSILGASVVLGQPVRPFLRGPVGLQGYVEGSADLINWQRVWFGELNEESPDIRDAVPTLPNSRWYRFMPGVD